MASAAQEQVERPVRLSARPFAVVEGPGPAESPPIEASSSLQPPLPSDLSEVLEDFVSLLAAMRCIDGPAGPHRWEAERAGFLALGRLRRSLTRACMARGLS